MQTVSTAQSPIAPPRKLPWYRKLGMQVLVALVLGIVVGFVFPKVATQLKLLGDMFLALIKAGVAPLVFLTIVHGIASAGDVKSAGRVGWRSIVYFEVVSTIALMFGLLFGNLLEIGKGMTAAGSATVPAAAAKAAPQGFAEFVMHVVPDNFVGAFAKGELLQVVVLAVMVGIGILAIPEGRREKINTGLDYISEVLFSFINLVMKTPSTSSLPMNVRLQSRCSASADALKVMGFLDRGRGTGLAKGTTVSVINVIPVASR